MSGVTLKQARNLAAALASIRLPTTSSSSRVDRMWSDCVEQVANAVIPPNYADAFRQACANRGIWP